MQPSPIDVTESPWVPSARRASFSIDCSSRSCGRSKNAPKSAATRPNRRGAHHLAPQLGSGSIARRASRLLRQPFRPNARSLSELGLSVAIFPTRGPSSLTVGGAACVLRCPCQRLRRLGPAKTTPATNLCKCAAGKLGPDGSLAAQNAREGAGLECGSACSPERLASCSGRCLRATLRVGEGSVETRRSHPASAAPQRCHSASGDRRRIEECERVLEAPPLRPGLTPTAGNLERRVKQVPADLLDAGFTCGNATGIEVDEVVPAAREVASSGNFDHRTSSQAIGRASPRSEDVQIHSGRKLKRATDKVAGRRCCK